MKKTLAILILAVTLPPIAGGLIYGLLTSPALLFAVAVLAIVIGVLCAVGWALDELSRRRRK